MRASLDFITDRFDYFNSLCFAGKLPTVALRISRARTYMGQLRYMNKRNLFGMKKITNITLSVSSRFDMEQDVIEDTLLHEMIHLHILVNQLRDSSAHGPLFRSIMDVINKKYGRNISISHRKTEQDQASDTQRRRHYICVSTLTDGRTGITLAQPSAIFRLWREISLFPLVKETRWYVSTNPYFNRFRRSRTVKIYKADRQELLSQLATARPLRNENGHIFAVKE